MILSYQVDIHSLANEKKRSTCMTRQLSTNSIKLNRHPLIIESSIATIEYGNCHQGV